ncbi:MAG: NACHT domain-containing protein [Thiobacillaceae bacterium]
MPRSRFQAYEELARLLLETHPQRRAQAALDRTSRYSQIVDPSLRKQCLAYFAFHKRQSGMDAGCTTNEAKQLLGDYLRSAEGADLPGHEAIAGANELLAVDADTAGLLVEKAPGEVTFVHALFEETLAGIHLAGWSLEKQEDFVKRESGNPRWTTSILVMLHTLPRQSDIDQLLRRAFSQTLPAGADMVRQSLAAEVVFGDFKCSPRLARDLAPNFFDLVETHDWFPYRERLLRLILEAATSSSARDYVRKKTQEWFPDPIRFRGSIYPALKQWPVEGAQNLLWLGLFNEDPGNKRAAAITIAEVFKGDPEIGARLRNLCYSVADAATIYSALEALFHGWWDYKSLKDTINAARKSAHPLLRFIGIRGRIKAGLQDDADLDEILSLARNAIYGMPIETSQLIDSLIDGWPNRKQVLDACLESGQSRLRRHNIDRDVAREYLLHFSSASGELDARVADLIRSDKYFLSDFGFRFGLKTRTYGPSVSAALDYRLDQTDKVMVHEFTKLAVASRSEHAKHMLIDAVNKEETLGIFWPIYGLLEGWGMDDPEVAIVLNAAIEWPIGRLQYIAHQLPAIIHDKTKCRAKLLEIARLEKVKRADFLVEGFTRLGVSHDDDEVMKAILRPEFYDPSIFDATEMLIAGFSSHTAVRELALKRIENMDAPWTALVHAYSQDVEIRPILARYLSSLPSSLRSILAASFGHRTVSNNALTAQLLRYRLETNAGVRTVAAIGYHEAVAGDASARSVALATLKEDAIAIGPQHDTIRQAAFAGLIALNQIAVLDSLPEWQPGKKLAINLFRFDTNRQVVAYVAKHWGRLKEAFGSDTIMRISEYSGNEWWCWDHLAPYVGDSPELRADFLEYCESEQETLSSRALEGLARELPRSQLLREHCLRYLHNVRRDKNESPYDQRRGEFIVGRIFGRQFGNDEDFYEALVSHARARPSAFIAGLSIARRASPPLAALYDELRTSNGQANYFGADYAYLFGALGSREDFRRFLLHLLKTSNGYLWEFLPFCIEPIANRIKEDEALASALFQDLISSDNGSEKASLPKLLAMSGYLADELRDWCEKELAVQRSGTTFTEFGLDLVAGEIRPTAHAMLEVLAPIQ